MSASLANLLLSACLNTGIKLRCSLYLQVGAIPVLIAGAISFTNDILTIIVPPGVPGQIIDNSTAAAGYAIGIAGMAILIELLFLLLRFLNIGIINIKITIFLIAVS